MVDARQPLHLFLKEEEVQRAMVLQIHLSLAHATHTNTTAHGPHHTPHTSHAHISTSVSSACCMYQLLLLLPLPPAASLLLL